MNEVEVMNGIYSRFISIWADPSNPGSYITPFDIGVEKGFSIPDGDWVRLSIEFFNSDVRTIGAGRVHRPGLLMGQVFSTYDSGYKRGLELGRMILDGFELSTILSGKVAFESGNQEYTGDEGRFHQVNLRIPFIWYDRGR